MTEFSPEKFEDKYEHYFPELQTAYRNAFEQMGERYDSNLVHAIDQQVLNESEPFYDADSEDGAADGNGEFRIELPDDPAERVTGVVVDEEKLDRVLTEYVETLETELEAVFGLDDGSPKA
ncbi:DUF5783 family protein [Halococcus saccharolyticus]|uniref:Uncharacterized protein n=1 Tax=Halococcus saccharolyticus DSM 5350 TaxID=1227455 RepID=M0MDM6_9EURY|nr:DUF5783 family protein [Halococcus saccharolyticus]EMA42779.1 hypothetical protein C449_16593 [Halococcus saccharolyticus DSM 5350]